jgi:hypothetical protein
MADHGVDGTAHGHNPRRWALLPRPGQRFADAKFVIHAGHKTSMGHDFAPVQSRPRRLLSGGDSTATSS